MSDLRNLVSGQDGCSDGSDGGYRNPLSRMAEQFWNERPNQEYHQRPEMHMAHGPRMTTHSATLGTQSSLNRGMMGEDQFGDFEKYFNGPAQNEGFGFERGFDDAQFEPHDVHHPNSQVPPDVLQYYFKSFIDSARMQQTFRPAALPELGLDVQDKAKIRNRSEVLARHLLNNHSEAYITNEISKFLQPIEEQPSFVNNTKFGKQESEWASEFETEMRHPMHQPNFEDVWRDSVATNGADMVREFHDFNREREFEGAWSKAEEQQRWVDEFEGKAPIQRSLNSIQEVTESLTKIDDPKLQSTNFMKLMSQLHKGEVEITEDSIVSRGDQQTEEWADQFDQYREEHPSQSDEWMREFEDKMNLMDQNSWANEFEEDNWQGMDDEWIKGLASQNTTGPIVPEYRFSDPALNPYIGNPEAYPIGIRLFNEGRLAESILAFEAELQAEPENSECWEHLGHAQAESDRDAMAISALSRAVELDETNLSAKMALAVSNTNDWYRDHALLSLKSWLDNHPDYVHISSKYNSSLFNDRTPFESKHEALSDMFIEAARLKTDSPDPDVQTALGLLFNLSLEYDKAVDCFQTALSVRPNDYLLWNKLGATLANSDRSAEALGCYYKSLDAKPSFVRARANLGISYMALKQYEKAAQYFLGAISLHPESKHIWSNLRIVFQYLERPDLIDKMDSQHDVEMFREDFEF
ncbi:hypothetical protein PROFUN_12429 [Planoprotostelium fungivorum]|uniref:Uncharacterized protein n=1 Tax=Planoprotostelium fungivorum TaxID=1890364 RepID=A0A2P6N5S3_9EUKA|nr:hypothetical protein PROFUN_12429 [Planoprotostelium fungivorum]